MTIYRAPQLSYPLTLQALGPCRGRVSYPPLTDTTLIAIIDLGEVIVDVRPDPTGDYRSREALEAVLQGLRPR